MSARRSSRARRLRVGGRGTSPPFSTMTASLRTVPPATHPYNSASPVRLSTVLVAQPATALPLRPPPAAHPAAISLPFRLRSGLAPKRGKGGSLASRIALLHSLAHIESWAVDLSWDIVARFGRSEGMPRSFFDDWAVVAEDEARRALPLLECMESSCRLLKRAAAAPHLPHLLLLFHAWQPPDAAWTGAPAGTLRRWRNASLRSGPTTGPSRRTMGCGRARPPPRGLSRRD